MKLAVIYDSKTGNTKQAGEWIAAGMNSVEGVEARAFSIGEVDVDFAKEAKGVVIGSPSYAATMTPAMHAWLMGESGKLKLAGKLAGAFATEQYTHGGAQLVVQSIMTMELVFGMLYYSSGSECGRPFIHIGPIGVNSNMEPHNSMEYYQKYFELYGQRFASKAMDLWG